MKPGAEPYAERVRHLRSEVASERAELRSALSSLESAAREARDSMRPSEWIRRHPMYAIGAGFVLGCWLGRRVRVGMIR